MLSINRKDIIRALSATGLLLLIPLIGSIVSTEVNWEFGDFLVAAFLLLFFFCSLAYIQKIKKIHLKVIVVSILIISFVLLWAELAVGIFGSPIAGS